MFCVKLSINNHIVRLVHTTVKPYYTNVSDLPRSLKSWVSTIQTVVLTADVFQLFIKYKWQNTVTVKAIWRWGSMPYFGKLQQYWSRTGGGDIYLSGGEIRPEYLSMRESIAAVSFLAIFYLVGQFQLHFLHRIPYFSLKAEPQFLTDIFLSSGPELLCCFSDHSSVHKTAKNPTHEIYWPSTSLTCRKARSFYPLEVCKK